MTDVFYPYFNDFLIETGFKNRAFSELLMERVPEPQLMLREEQAKAYCEADFEEPHSSFICWFQKVFPGFVPKGPVLDLGCGPGDILVRFAKNFPESLLHGVDGSETMLSWGKKKIQSLPEISSRILFFRGILPQEKLPREKYDVIISNSLLHHLKDPQVLWNTIKKYSLPLTKVFVMDLKRPGNRETAADIVELYAGNEPKVLKTDFFNSLLAAFQPGEVSEQLKTAGLGHLSVKEIRDRHLLVYGQAGLEPQGGE